MKIEVEISPYITGRAGEHRVEILAKIEPSPGAVQRLLTATAPRFGADGVERPINICLEEAFADILQQALG